MMKNYTYSSVAIVIIRILKNLNLRIKQGQFHSDKKFIYIDNKKSISKHLLILVLASTGKPFFLTKKSFASSSEITAMEFTCLHSSVSGDQMRKNSCGFAKCQSSAVVNQRVKGISF